MAPLTHEDGMAYFAALALLVTLEPVYVCAQHPTLAFLVAAVLGACIRLERLGAGRWRWLAVACVAWLAFGLREWIVPGVDVPEELLRLDLVAIAPVLWILTAIALLRAGGALSPPWPIVLHVLAVAFAVASVVGSGLVAFVLAREAVYPWTDWSAPHAVLHVINESASPARVTWSWEGDVPHRDWRDPDALVSAHTTRLDMVGPIMPLAGAASPLPADTARSIVLVVQVRADDGAVLQHSCTARLDGHLQVRISDDGQVFFSSGGESWLGAPCFGAESPLTAN